MAQSSIIITLANYIKNIRLWVKSHKGEFVLLVIVLIIATYMRLYRIPDYMTFLGDEGRDVIIVKRFVQKGDIMLIGPGTSIGNMYLGPLYYYMMAPALLLANYSPVGPAVMIGLMGIATVFFVWFTTRSWFGKTAGFIASFLYAISPTVIIYSRSSWNPNIMPFFALLAVWAIWKVWHEKQYWWLTVVGISVAAALQSHYLALLLVPPLGLFWLITLYAAKNSKSLKRFILFSVSGGVLFLLLMSPLAIFDIRHNYMNFNAVKAFFTDRQTTVSIKPWKALPGMWPQLTQITTRLMGGFDVTFGNWIALGVVASAFLVLKKGFLRVFTYKQQSAALILVWLVSGLLGLALYKQQIYDHYYGFLFPVPFILIAGILGSLSERYRFRGLWLTIIVVTLLTWVSLKSSPLKYEPNRQYPRSAAVAEFILDKSGAENFNFAVIAERNYEGAYQYFLEEAPNFRVIDPQNTKDTITQQLFVVCEMQISKCDPTHNAKAEVANFGWSKIESTDNVNGVIVFKLVHSIPAATPSATPVSSKKK